MNKQIFINKGKLITKTIPEFNCKSGELVIEVLYSAFSSGTEFGEIKKSSKSLLERARQSPEKIGKAIEMIKNTGLKNTINFVEDTQLSLQATGYSLSGIVKSVGEGINDIAVGDYVACSGAQYAHHAREVKVSRQLCAKIPSDLPTDIASTVTLGAIAMQGIRQADVSLGEKVAVIGMGVIGQIASQILLAAGANVTGIDIDNNKLSLAKENDIKSILNANDSDFASRSSELTNANGFDKVLICSSDSSSSSAKTAFEIARHRATVVMIGGIGLDLDRSLMYYKELNFVASMSYGPGRYERDYEERGLDLPISYVRWTENRNMISYLEVVKNRENNFRNLIGKIIDFDKADKFLNSENSRKLNKPLIIIEYNQGQINSKNLLINENQSINKTKEIINIGMVGAGGFAKNFTLPNLNSIKTCKVCLVSSSDSASLINMQEKYNIDVGVSNIDDALKHDLDAVVVANRHSEHFLAIKKCFNKNKHVFIEKPTINKSSDLDELTELFKDNKHNNIVIYTGYNRAFSPHINFIESELKNVKSPVMMSYNMNAGILKNDNWQYDLEEGGRNIGEAVHIYHLFGKIFKSKPYSLSVSSISGNQSYKPYDNFSVIIRYENGSIGNLNYTSMGSNAHSKESFIIHSGGKTILSENYKETRVIGGRTYKTPLPEKGHKEIFESFISSLSRGSIEMTREEQLSTMRIAINVESELRG